MQDCNRTKVPRCLINLTRSKNTYVDGVEFLSTCCNEIKQTAICFETHGCVLNILGFMCVLDVKRSYPAKTLHSPEEVASDPRILCWVMVFHHLSLASLNGLVL